jgi:6-phosphogluconolactonase
MIRLQRFADLEALSRATAALFAKQAKAAIAARGRFSVLLAGGETPRRTYELLAAEPLRSTIPWSWVHFFWGDERCVSAQDPQRNETMVRRALLDQLELRPDQVHPIRSDLAPEQAAADYGAEIDRFFAPSPPCFDLVLLGLGTDGHTASLLPGSAALEETVSWTAVTRRREESFSRVTLTAALLNQAALVVFLVAGRDKAGVLQSILTPASGHPSFPAQLIRPLTGALHWYVDCQAASLLPGGHAAF